VVVPPVFCAQSRIVFSWSPGGGPNPNVGADQLGDSFQEHPLAIGERNIGRGIAGRCNEIDHSINIDGIKRLKFFELFHFSKVLISMRWFCFWWSGGEELGGG
jgi:hypothetical protein